MRMAFGLVGILVAIGVVVWIMSAFYLPSAQQASTVQKNVVPKVEQIAGHTRDGERASDTIKVDAETSGGRMTGLIVTDVKAGGAMQNYFGLQKGDSIIEIGPQSVKGMGSADEAKDFLVDTYQRSGQITIVRDEKRMTLPAKPAPGAATPPTANPTATPLQSQLDAIKGAGQIPAR
jgi:hypothetical protein